MEKFNEADQTYRPGGSSSHHASPPPSPARSSKGPHGMELYMRYKVERELYIMRMYFTWGAGVELFVFIAGLFMWFGNTESEVAAMIFFHLPHLFRPFAMWWFVKHWLPLQHIIDAALFDATDAVALLKKSKRFFRPLSRPTIAIVVLTSFATLLDFIHMMIRWFSFRSLIDFANKPPKMYLLFFTMFYLFMDVFLVGWWVGLKWNAHPKYQKLITRALRRLLGRGGAMAVPTSKSRSPPPEPRTFTNFRHGQANGAAAGAVASGADPEDGKAGSDDDGGSSLGDSSDSGSSGNSSGGSTTSSDDSDGGADSGREHTTDDGVGTAPGRAVSFAADRGAGHQPPPAVSTAPQPGAAHLQPPQFIPSPANNDAPVRPQRLPPLERRGMGGAGPRGAPPPGAARSTPFVFSPKGAPAPAADASDPSDAGYLSNIPGPAVGSSSPPSRSGRATGTGLPGMPAGAGGSAQGGDAGYHIGV